MIEVEEPTCAVCLFRSMFIVPAGCRENDIVSTPSEKVIVDCKALDRVFVNLASGGTSPLINTVVAVLVLIETEYSLTEYQ